MSAAAGITLEDYERLVAAFKLHPGKPETVARLTGIDRRSAWKGWHRGWKSRNLPPISERLAEPPEVTARRIVAEASQSAEGAARRLVEDATARAVLEATAEEAARAAKEKARRDAQEARAQAEVRAEARDDAVGVLEEERKLRRAGRAVAGQNLVASAKWGRAHQLVADEIVRRVERERESLSTDQLADLARTMALVDRTRMALLREASELERLHRGDPLVTVGVTPTEMTTDEAVKEIERANAALLRYRRRGLELIEGGAQVAAGPIIDVTPAQ